MQLNLTDTLLKVMIGEEFEERKKAAKKLNRANYQQCLKKYDSIQCGQKYVIFGDCNYRHPQ